VPLYIVLRQQWGAIGLAIASSVSILLYVLVLGWLQRRRFEREAIAKGTTLQEVPGMLGTAVRLAVAAAVAVGVGLGLRVLLLQLLPGVHLMAILARATTLCAVGVGLYVALARLFGVRELAEVQGIVLRRLGLRPRA